jgi:hypothetical protein
MGVPGSPRTLLGKPKLCPPLALTGAAMRLTGGSALVTQARDVALMRCVCRPPPPATNMLLFPPAPSAGDCVQDCLLSKGAELQALALGVGRLAKVVPRQEVHGPATTCCLRLASGAYLRVLRDTPEAADADGAPDAPSSWRLSADGSEPAAEDCVWLAQKGGVALHLKVVFTHKQSGLVLASGSSSRVSLSDSVTEDARFRVDAALVAGAVNVQSRSGLWLGVDSSGTGEVGLSVADPPKRRHLLWMLDPLREQTRVDAYRRAVAASSMAPMTPTSGDDDEQLRTRASLTAAAAARDAAEQRASLAYERAAAARERVAAALAEQAAADAAVASARMAAAAAAAAEADLVAAARAPRELGDEEEWVPISRGAGDGLEQ